MKNRYCLFCGTLLPEDGVCLRCGAKYELADDGQMKVIPRKVKKVSAKPSIKKKVSGKKADPSNAETQTIPIPEDIFSFSDGAKHEKKQADWTKDKDYTPDFIVLNDRETDTNEEKTTENKGIGGYAKTYIAIFLVITILTSVGVYYGLRKTQIINKPSVLQESTNNEEITGKQSSEESALSELSFRYYQGNDFLQGFYSFDSESDTLLINGNGDVPLSFFLLPLIDNQHNKNNPVLPLSIIELIGDPGLPLVLSDWVQSGIIKRITVTNEHNPDNQAIYDIITKDGLVQQVSYRVRIVDESASENAEFFETTKTTYEYDEANRLVAETVISVSNNYRQEEQELTFKYASDGGLSEVFGLYNVENEGWTSDIIIEVKKNSDNQITSMSYSSEEEAPPVGADYTYNDQGYVRKLVMHESPSSYIINYNKQGRIVSVSYLGQ